MLEKACIAMRRPLKAILVMIQKENRRPTEKACFLVECLSYAE
jgi:hypothetical protein